jgi:NADH:ubiquinone oxidoreductase subunit F (NADH-binding)
MNYVLLIAFLNVQEPNRLRRGVPNEYWDKLFRYYNENSGEKRLGMSCSPCFEKVYWYCKVVLRQMAGIAQPKSIEEVKEKSNEFRSQNIV